MVKIFRLMLVIILIILASPLQSQNFFEFTSCSWDDVTTSSFWGDPMISKCPTDTSTTVLWVEVADTTGVNYHWMVENIEDWPYYGELSEIFPDSMFEILGDSLILKTGFYPFISNLSGQITLSVEATNSVGNFTIAWIALWAERAFLSWEIAPSVICKESYYNDSILLGTLFKAEGYCKDCSYTWGTTFEGEMIVEYISPLSIIIYPDETTTSGKIYIQSSENYCGQSAYIYKNVNFEGCPNDLYIEEIYQNDISYASLRVEEGHILENYPAHFSIEWQLSDPSVGIINPLFDLSTVQIEWLKEDQEVWIITKTQNNFCGIDHIDSLKTTSWLSIEEKHTSPFLRLQNEILFVNKKDNEEVFIRRVDGATIRRTNEKEIYVGDLPPGLYLVTCGQKTVKIVL